MVVAGIVQNIYSLKQTPELAVIASAFNSSTYINNYYPLHVSFQIVLPVYEVFSGPRTT